MSGVGIDEASRGGRALFWVGTLALAASIAIGAGVAWSTRQRIPFGSQAYIEQVRALKRAGEVDAAVRELEAEQRINGYEGRASLRLAKTLAQYGRPGAVEAMARAADYSYDPSIHLDLAATYLRVSRIEDALATIDRALLFSGRRVDVRIAAGGLYARAGDEARARAVLNEALTLDPDSRAVRQALQRLDGIDPPRSAGS